MATAPDPRDHPTDGKDKAATVVMSFEWTDAGGMDRQADLAFGNLGAKDGRLVRQHTGMALEAFTRPIVEGISGVGIDSVAVLWWLARTRNGETLTFEECEAQCTYTSSPSIRVDDGQDPKDPTQPPNDSGTLSLVAV